MCLSGWLPMAYKIKNKKHPVSLSVFAHSQDLENRV